VIDIQTYIEESLFSGQSAEDIAHNIERKLIIQPPKETVEDYLAWECVWIRLTHCIYSYNVFRNPIKSKSYFDVPENVDLVKLFIDLFVANYKGLRLELSDQNIKTISKESYVLNAMPMLGYDEKWDGMFELKRGESQQSIEKKLKDKIIKVKVSPAEDGRPRYIFDNIDFCHIALNQTQLTDVFEILKGRSNCLLINKLNGTRSWKMAIRKAYRTQLENVLKTLKANGVTIGESSARLLEL
jgi:hypothetical protein